MGRTMFILHNGAMLDPQRGNRPPLLIIPLHHTLTMSNLQNILNPVDGRKKLNKSV